MALSGLDLAQTWKVWYTDLTMDFTRDLVQLVDKLARVDGMNATAWPNLTAWRRHAPTPRDPAIYAPSLCIIAQGRKVAYLGEDAFEGNPHNYLLSTLTLPIENEVLEATPEKPLLGIALSFDAAMVSKLLVDMDAHVSWSNSNGLPSAAVPCEMTPRVANSVRRFLRVVHSPLERDVLAGALERELKFEVLRAPNGAILRDFVLRNGSASRVARAVSFIERQFREPIDIDAIATHVGMSSSSLHEHFKKATSLSPIQFAKRLRLHEARSQLLAGRSASEAAFDVGYSSLSQFSREFRRMFSTSPSKVTLSASPLRCFK